MCTQEARAQGDAEAARRTRGAIEPAAVDAEELLLRARAECDRLRSELELERRRGQEERARLTRELEEAVQSRDDFLSTASHDLKAPLSVLQLSLQTLVYAIRRGHTDCLAPERLVPRLEAVNQRVEDLVNMLQKLLDISRIRAGKIRLFPLPIELGAFVAELCARWREPLAKAGCELSVTTCSPGEMRGSWDRARLEQILAALLSNALKFGAGQPVEVQVGMESEEAVISVADQGVGIDPADHERIFGCFERVVGERQQAGSFGLGLWIARRLANAMGGSLAVQSACGEGAAFTVRLPAAARRVEPGA